MSKGVKNERYALQSKEDFEVIAWPGDYGLASIDVECNKLILYMRFMQAKFKVTHPRNPAWKSELLPGLIQNDYRTSTYEKCVEDLRFLRYSLDFGQSFRRCSEIHAFTVMTHRMLGPIMEYMYWINPKNLNDWTRLWYSKHVPPLISVWYIYRRKQKAVELVRIHENIDESQDFYMKEYFKKHAKECFEMLSARLGSGDFFFDTPCSLDCVVYSYLAPLIKIPFPSDEVSQILRTFNNLVAYVHRIDINYQPELVEDRLKMLPLKKPEEDDMASLKLKIFSSIFVACAMFGYALANKIISFH